MSTNTEAGKKAALDQALAQITKQFGEGSVMKMGDHAKIKVETFSSGSIAIDEALGGGYAKGRIVEIYGPESSGKCLTADTYILTAEGGYKTIGEIFNENGVNPSCTTKVTEMRYALINKDSVVEYTTNFTNNGKRPVKTVKTRTGTEIEATHNHPLLTISKRGYLVWKKVSDISAGDYLVTPRSGKIFGKTKLSRDEAYALGIIIADAHVGLKGRLSITNDDPCIKDFIANKLGPALGFEKTPKFYKNNKNNPNSESINYHFNDILAKKEFLEKYGVTDALSKLKTIPRSIMSGDKETVKHFLMGYLDCESSFSVPKSELSVVSASVELAKQVRLLLSQFGIMSVMSEKFVKKYPENTYYTVNIRGLEFEKFRNLIGTDSKLRLEKFGLAREDKKIQTNIDSIPNMEMVLEDMLNGCADSSRKEWDVMYDYIGKKQKAKLTYNRLEKILDVIDWRGWEPENLLKSYLSLNYFFDEVISCEDSGEKPTFDFAMEKSHSFIANGIVSHNTTLALHAIAEVQKAGGTAAFVDAEHALDPAYAKNLGVNIDELIISQPDYGEQALEIVDALVRSGAVDLVVVDSVAALVPKAEIEGNMGDSFMGLQARLMSQALRKITGAISKSNTTVVFINQIRMKIGVMFWNPETTTGWNALKFYASQRIDVRRKEKIETGTGDNKEATGSKTKIKIVKNKVAPPFREAEVDVLFGEGISKVGEIIDIGSEKGIIKKAGAFYSYGETKLGQGRENARDFLKQNKELADKIEAEIRIKKA